MIKLTQTQIDILNQDSIEAFYCVQISKLNNIKRFSTYFRDITLSDGRVFIGNSKLVSLEAPKVSTEVDRERYTITLADPDFEFGYLSEQGLVGTPIEILLVLIDPLTKLPITNVNEVFTVYRGQIDNTKYQVSLESIGEVIYTIDCASPVANLDAIKPYYSSRTYVRENVNSSDSSFDQVYQGSGKIRLKWGRT